MEAPMNNTKAALLVALMAAGLSACANKQSMADLPPQPGGTTGTEQAGGPGGSSGASGTAVPGSNADFVARMNGRNTIYFATDTYNVDDADATALRAQAQWLQQYPNKRATIEGHCDERGTREYNLALGERRANAAKNYLVSLGIDATRISTVSYGKERPAAMGSNEQAWAQNRRAVTVTID
jgi:peptidoglycan-associated lipoprotein